MPPEPGKTLAAQDAKTDAAESRGPVPSPETERLFPPPPQHIPTRAVAGAAEIMAAAIPQAEEPISEPPAVAGYEILGTLGAGGMGVVYKARQIKARRVVALKMIRGGWGAEPQRRSRFRTEIEAVAALAHPNIVPIYEVGEQEGCDFFSMEFMPGGGLDAKLAGAPQAGGEAAELVAQLAGAVQSAHRRGVVHRDLKPSNVLLAADGTPKIADFGLAKRLEGESGQTRTGEILGTPCYMAPEQALGKVGPACDIYSLGAILYELLTGRPPHQGVTPMDTLQQVMTLEPVRPSRLQPKVPRDLETICLKCLNRDPAKRYADAGSLADDLQRFLGNKPIRARPAGMVERALKWARRRPAAAALIAVLVVSVFGFLGGLLWHNAQLHEAAERERELAGAAERARIAAQSHAAEADKQRRTAEENLAKAQSSARRMMEVARLVTRTSNAAKIRLGLLEDALTAYEQLPPSADPAIKHESALTCMTLAYGLAREGEIEKADGLYPKAVSRLEELIRDHPQKPGYRLDLARCQGLRGNVLRGRQRLAESEKLLRQSCEILEKLSAEYPGVSIYRDELTRNRQWLEMTLKAAGKGGP